MTDERTHDPLRRNRRWLQALGAATCLALVVAGCTESDDEGDGGSDDTTTQPVEDVLGDPDPASGDPVVVGYVSDGGGAAIDTTSSDKSAQAAAEYVNEYLGGIAGRPIQLEMCQTSASPEGATACANELISAGAVAVLVGASGVGEQLASPIIEEGIPYVSFQAGSAAELSSPEHAYSLATGVGGIGAIAQYAADNDLPTIGGILIDVPSATAIFEAFAGVFDAAGVDFNPVPIPPGTADMTSQVTAATDSDMFFVLGDAAFCTAALEAVGTVAPETPVVSNQDCIDSSVAAAVPDIVEGSLVSTTANLSPEGGNEELDLYRAVMAEFGDGAEADGTAVDGYSVVLGLVRLMEGLEGDVTAETVDAQIVASEGASLPLSQGQITIDCGNSPVSFLPAVCTSGVFLTVLDAEGQPTEYEFVDPVDLLGEA